MLDVALDQIRRGRYIFPVYELADGWCACGAAGCKSPGKHPRTHRGLLDSTVAEEQVRDWWARWPGANVGIDCGRSGVVVVDVDVKKGAQGAATLRWVLERHAAAFAAAEIVSTPTGGMHYYFAGTARSTQGIKGVGIGVDVRAAGGYVLAPGSSALSTYAEDKTPVRGSGRAYTAIAAPATLPAYPLGGGNEGETFTLAQASGLAPVVDGRDAVPAGEHRSFVLALAGHLRSKAGLSEAAIQSAFEYGLTSVLADHDPKDPFSIEELTVGQFPATNLLERDLALEVERGGDVRAEKLPVWLLEGFILKGELALIYGDGGVGKSSWVSWLMARTTQLGVNAASISKEEPFARVVARVRANKGDLSRLFSLKTGGLIRFREHGDVIRRFIVENEIGLLYFDSIKSHFTGNEDAATLARANLDGLAEIAQQENCTILGTMHENKEGAYMGSTEMRNVPRSLIEAKRDRNSRLVLRVDKCNVAKTTDKLAFVGATVPYVGADGRVQKEIVYPDRSYEPIERERSIFVYELSERIDSNTFTIGDAVHEAAEKGPNIRERVRAYVRDHPLATATKASRDLAIPFGTASRYLTEIRKSEVDNEDEDDVV